MRHTRTFRLILFALSASMIAAAAAGPAIGVASARGEFRIDQAAVAGNGTLFSGSTVETGAATPALELSRGARMFLGQRSRGTVFSDRFVLEQGESQLSGALGYRIEARALRIAGSTADARVLVALEGPSRVRVATVAGAARVTSPAGVLLASLAPGRTLEFDQPAAGAAAPASLTGVVEKRGGTYVLTDQTTKVTVELVGEGLANAVGKRVRITGVIDTAVHPALGASQVIRVASVTYLGAAAGGAAAAGMAVGTKVVIAGVAVAAVGTGAAIGLTRGQDSNPAPLSR